MTLLFFAVLPILWLMVALSGLKMAAWKACPVALILSLFASVAYFGWNLLLRIGPADNRAKHLELELWGGPKMSDLIDEARGELKHEVAHDD